MKPMVGELGSEAASLLSENPPTDDRLVVKWLEAQPNPLQAKLAPEMLADLLAKAAQPRHASGNACIKLCYFVEQCRNSKVSNIREVAVSEKTCLDLFNLYVEWNEKNQHRSMRRVLDLLASLISLNPDEEYSGIVKQSILRRLLSIITHQSVQPLVKPAFKSLEYFLGKGTISTEALIDCYVDQTISGRCDSGVGFDRSSFWDSFISEVFEWLILPDISPAAGKFLVTLFVKLRRVPGASQAHVADHTVLWQRWIRNGLCKNPETLENMKNYLFPPLFKLDRSGSLLFLGDLNRQGPISGLQSQDSNAHSLLQLAAIEVGKKSGLVEEPNTDWFQKDSKKPAKCVVLEEPAIGDLLTHSSETVRSLAFSVLVSSSSTIRPFSAVALNLLQMHMGILFADTDAKFRNEILSSTKHMIERFRGAMAYLKRELENAKFLLTHDEPARLALQERNQEFFEEISGISKMHERFIQWYIEFLSGELIPTASYQRHITALKAIALVLRSGNLEDDMPSNPSKISDKPTVWPYSIKFFTSGTMRLVLDLLMDPFEDVRANATVIMKLASHRDFTLDSSIKNMKDKVSDRSQIDNTIKQATSRISAQQSLNPGSALDVEGIVAIPPTLLDFIDRAQEMSKRTGRADYADGVARSYEILYSLSGSSEARLALVENLVEQLDVKIETAEKDLAQAVLEAPIHGNFAALNLVWDSVDYATDLDDSSDKVSDDKERWDNLQFRMLKSCKRIWRAVRDVLCNDSPEGHLPQDIDEVNAIDTKDILSYSFRAIHESSNLMRNLVGKLKSNWRTGSPVLPAEVFSGLGNLTFEQLSTLRHRGAFSTVSLTFARCCQLTQYHNSNSRLHQSLLERWYQGALKCISDQTSTTRRSAGIPALLTGILSSNAQKPAFEDVMEELKVLARRPVKLSKSDETSLPQVHAMNCLKEIFKSSILGKRYENHIAECLKIAADSLNSEIWAIRNCGLILLRSLIDALFGTNESKAVTEAGWDGRSIKLSYDKYPALPELLIKLLDADTSKLEDFTLPKISSVESMFPALDVIRRAGPPNSHRNEIYKSVSVHLGSKVWHVREIAARTICTLLLHEEWLPAVIELIETGTNSTNRLHGVLMAVNFVLERRLTLNPESATDGLDRFASLLKSSKMWSFFESGCPEILAAYLEVSHTIARILLSDRLGVSKIAGSQLRSVRDHLFLHDAYEEYLDLMKTYPTLTASIQGFECSVNTALACNAVVRRAVFTAALRKDTLGLQNIISFSAALDTDVALAAIEAVPDAWGSHHTSVDALFGLTKAYMGAIEMTQSPEVRSVAVVNLAEVVDKLFGRIDSSNIDRGQSDSTPKRAQHPSLDLNEMIRGEIKELGRFLQDGPKTPQLSNAEIRISGSLLVCEYVSQKHFNRALNTYKPRMEAWGKLLVRAGNSRSDFETRRAAAAALASFYNNPYFDWYIPNDECVLPSIFALYDTLNDDDDEIRNISAETVSALLRKSLVPLAARFEMADYISKMHVRARSFAWNLVCRMTGSPLETVDNIRFRLQPVGPQLSRAMEDDDALFVEEEQNLFVDEVREAKLWSKIFEDTALDTWNWERAEFDIENTWSQPHASVAAWVMEGLLALNAMLFKEDGPLGWTSKPKVYALVTRLLLSANAIIQRHEGLVTSATGRPVPGNRIIGGIIFALEQFVTLSRDKKIHESLLLEVQGKPSLPLAILQRVIPDVSKLIKENILFASARTPL